MKRMKKRKGSINFLIISVMIILILLGLVMMEFTRLITTVNFARSAVEKAVMSVVTENYYNAYQGMREGYTSTSKKKKDAFKDVSSSDVIGRLSSDIKASKSGSKIEKSSDGLLYEIKDISVNVSKVTNKQKEMVFSIETRFILVIPLRIGGFDMDIRLHQKVKSTFIPIF